MRLENFFKSVSVLLMVMVVMVSCNETELPIDISEEDVTLRVANETGTTYDQEGRMRHFDCFTFDFPVSLIFPDGTTFTASDIESLRTSIKDWFTANPNSVDKPTFVYPFNITFKNGDVKTIMSDQMLRAAFRFCHKRSHRQKCFDLQFPLTVILSDGSAQLVNDMMEIKDLKQAGEELELQYPVTVILEDGTTQLVNDQTEMQDLRKDCKDGRERCFELNFPLTLVLADGSTVIANDWTEVKTLLDDDEEFELQYPVNVTLEDGTVVTLNNETEMEDLKEDCK